MRYLWKFSGENYRNGKLVEVQQQPIRRIQLWSKIFFDMIKKIFLIQFFLCDSVWLSTRVVPMSRCKILEFGSCVIPKNAVAYFYYKNVKMSDRDCILS